VSKSAACSVKGSSMIKPRGAVLYLNARNTGQPQPSFTGIESSVKQLNSFSDQLDLAAARVCSVGQVACIGAHAPASLGPLAAISNTNLYCEEVFDLCCSYGARCEGYAGMRPYQGYGLEVLLNSTSAVPLACRSTPVRPHRAAQRVSRGI
jgi:hypothetical protein